MIKNEIPYQQDSSLLFAKIAHAPWAIFLDSGQPGHYGRYDILTAHPFKTIVTRGDKTIVTEMGIDTVSNVDAFATLKSVMQSYAQISFDLPFEGGAIGYFSYDLARSIEVIPETSVDAENIPEMMVGLYDWALVVDHQLHISYLVSHLQHSSTLALIHQLHELFLNENIDADEIVADFKVTSEVASNMSEAAYEGAFNKILNYIQEGDCYQVNLAQRFCVTAEGDAWQAYCALRNISPAPFMAYMNLPQLQVLSSSPERFLRVKHNKVETRPIKGTRPRSKDPEQDAEFAHNLETSLKDRAENLMIVDLLRNDIGKSCALGSVRVEKLFALESFANVHHLVSTVTAELAEGKTSIDLLRGCFPGGSITGAPKLRSMEIIEELEPNRRGIYCGAIGYIGFDGNMDTNIAIRTAVYSQNTMRFWAGGGIVADSLMQKEYRETWDKASSMLDLMKVFGRD